MVVPLHMGWRHVLFANWPVDPDVVAPHVPDALTLDTYDGRAWLTILPFVNVDVRPYWLPAGTGVRVPEVNLRTYVTREGRPAIYFFNLDADGPLTVLGARATHFLPYYFANIDVTVGDDDRVRVESRRRHPGARPATLVATYGSDGERFRSERGSLAEFLTERHRYYTESPNGTLRYADVYHERWPLDPATMTVEENTVFEANAFDEPDAEPLCYYSPGVETVASRNRRWRSRSERRTPPSRTLGTAYSTE